MPDLHFSVEHAEPVPFSVAPLLGFKLRLDCTPPNHLIHSVALRCQIRIEPTRRRYQPGEQDRLLDLFGPPERWHQTLRSTLWTNTQVMVPAFTGSVVVDLPVPCSFDFNVAATRYFHALQDGEIPLCLLFSGTIFHEVEGALQVAPIPWEKETRFRLPVKVWSDMMDHYHPNSVWLCLPRELFDRLDQFKQKNGVPTWERSLEELLQRAEIHHESSE